MRIISEESNGVIHNIYPDGMPYPKEMLDPNIGGRLSKCVHIYKNVGVPICPYCQRDTHEVDWDLYKQQRKEHRDKYGILYNKTEWWSI